MSQANPDVEQSIGIALVKAIGEGRFDFDCKRLDGRLQTVWVNIRRAEDILSVARAFRAAGARLATMTVFRPKPSEAPGFHTIAYHFVFEGTPVTVKVPLHQGEDLPSITPIYRCADWEEREMMELSSISMGGHPNPKRLFLDESLDAGIFDRFVPYSELTDLPNHDAVWTRIREANRRGLPSQGASPARSSSRPDASAGGAAAFVHDEPRGKPNA